MQPKLDQLKTILGKVSDLGHAAALLGWDQQTYMPPSGAEDRGEQLATLHELAHQFITSDETGRLLDDLAAESADLEPTSDDARLIAVVTRNYDKQRRVPDRWVAEFSRAQTTAFDVWVQARAYNDFPRFQPHLERIVELRREYAAFFAPFDHLYDPLLDDYEPGMKTAEVQAIFNDLRPKQVALIKQIAAKPEIDDSFLRRAYDEQKQWEFGVEVISKFGYDWQRGRQDKAAHPFTTSFGQGDVRITTRFDPERAASALFSTMHECGHALYDMGLPPTLRRTPLSNGASMALHESQSRMWENLVGRSHDFWVHFYPRFQSMFPEHLANVSLEDFYRGINKVEPSLIRVEADEATYNLHIMLRMELEIALMEGSLAVADLPAAWNARMQDYLGLTPPTDTLGVLQDIHWADGYFGYFPTYALGNLVSAQLWEQITADIPGLGEQIRAGQFDSLLAWLREKVHRHGRKFNPQDLVKSITGSTINAGPYMRYLESKFGQIYAL